LTCFDRTADELARFTPAASDARPRTAASSPPPRRAGDRRPDAVSPHR